MKGVVLAGGTGSRLYPLTRVTNKHLLPVGHEPMIFHPIKKMTQAGITKIMVVTGVEHMGSLVGLLGSGREFGCDFTYRVQDEAGGIAQALSLAEDFAAQERLVVILGDNLFKDPIAPFIARFLDQEEGARVALKSVRDPQRFGVAEIEGNKVIRITEKPDNPTSDYAVTGLYLYDHSLFDVIRRLKPSPRGEYEITDVNNAYLEAGKLEFDILSGWWTDAGAFSSLALANQLVAHDPPFEEDEPRVPKRKPVLSESVGAMVRFG
ncbi:MAG: sugar phosphate nucleotidyltransferase [Candidatus Sumerlaeota bacterium]|nr:sugar phosphate nucleotidyltransferase [Candidatus Sumerlaeota bacterium]